MIRPLFRRACYGAATVVLITSLPAPAAAQKSPAPTNVTVTANGSGATVAWTPVRGKGVTYRVLRGPDLKAPGVDLTPPIGEPSFADTKVVVGTTYCYQVVAASP
jgi:hypothetical protein